MQISIDDRKFLWLAALVVAVLLRQSLAAALLPFVLALAFAALAEPLVGLIERRGRLPRSVATVVGLFTLVLAGGYLSLIVTTQVLAELVQMGALLQRYQRVPVDLAATIIDELNRLNEVFDQRGLPQVARENILRAVEDLTRAGVGLLTQGINFTLNAVSKVPSFILVLVIALIATFFIVKDRERLVDASLGILPAPMRGRARAIQQRISADLVGFFKAQLVLFSLTTVVVGASLLFIGVDYWMTLALVAGILDAIPVVGPGFLLVPWAAAAWALGAGELAVKLIVIFVVSFLIRQAFQAKILGDFIGVHPLPMLVALYAGVHLFGVLGFIVAPVLVIVAKAVYLVTKDPPA